MRTKTTATNLPDRIDSKTILISSHGAIFTLDGLSDKEIFLDPAPNTRAHLLKERAEPKERWKVRKKPTHFVSNYLVIHYFHGIPLSNNGLTITIDELRKQKVKILKLPSESKKRIKNARATMSLEKLTETIVFER